jgi:hypothetical protein
MKLKALFVSTSAFLLLLLVQGASAHTNLLTEFPISESIVEEIPSAVNLDFSEDLLVLGKANSVQVLDPLGLEITTGDAKVFNNSISRSLNSPNLFGSYLVKYRVVAEDGHVITGKYTFSLKKISTATPVPQTPKSDQEPQKSFRNQYAGLIFIAIGSLVLTIIWRKQGK